MSSGRIRRVMAYHPDQYWQGLLDERYDFSGVGHPEFPPAFNRVLYHQMRLAVLAAIVEHGIDVEDVDVLEIGPGTGYWVDLWDELGARSVHGLDLAVSAVDRLRAAYPRHRFQEGDLGSPHLPIDGSFDLISAMSVLLHIVDERRFQTALTHIASRLRPGGTVLLMEPLVLHRWWGPPVDASSNSRARTLAEWNEALASAGLVLVGHRPVTALLANVCDTRHRLGWWLHQVYWGALRVFLNRLPRLSGPVGRRLRVLDGLIMRFGLAPSAKVMIIRRAPAAARPV